jgi:hypothetical protein
MNFIALEVDVYKQPDTNLFLADLKIPQIYGGISYSLS